MILRAPIFFAPEKAANNGDLERVLGNIRDNEEVERRWEDFGRLKNTTWNTSCYTPEV